MSSRLLALSVILVTLPFIQTINFIGLSYPDLITNNILTFPGEVVSWSGATGTSTCDGMWLLGGVSQIGPGQSFSKTFLPLATIRTHVIVEIVLYVIDNWEPDDEILITIDSEEFSFKGISSSNLQENQCGSGSKNDGIYRLQIMKQHTSASLTIQMTSQLTGPSSNKAFGIRETAIHFTNDLEGFAEGFCIKSKDDSGDIVNRCCPDGEYLDEDYVCQPCSAGCKTCLGPGAAECGLCEDGFYPDGSQQCQVCNGSCETCDGGSALDCTSCPFGEFLDSDGSCQPCHGSCESCSGGTDTDCLSCDAGDFLYWNGKCLATCEAPLEEDSNPIGGDMCVYPCMDTEYLFWDGSCASQCENELIQGDVEGKNVCEFPCDLGTQYYNQDTSCSATCDLPNVARNGIGNAQYCDEPCADEEDFLFENGTCLTTCSNPYISSEISGLKRCDQPCSLVEYFVEANESCVENCPSPHIQSTILGISTCAQPCSKGEFYNQDSESCEVSCDYPLVQFQLYGFDACSLPCENDGQFYNIETENCQTQCITPLEQSTLNGVDICQGPCQEDYYFYEAIGECVSDCLKPMIQISIQGVNVCQTPCDVGKFYQYYDKTCLDNCDEPMYAIERPQGYSICQPCQDNHFLSTENDTCLDECNFPYQVVYDDGINICQTPTCYNEENFVFENFTCGESCPDIYIPSIEANFNVCKHPCSDQEGDGQYYFNLDTGECVRSCTNSEAEINKNGVQSCSSDEFIQLNTNQAQRTMAQYGEFATNTATTGIVILQATNTASVSGFGMIVLSKFLYYIRYINLTYPSNLQAYLDFSNATASLPGLEMPDSLSDKIHQVPIAYRYSKFGISSSYMVNYWGNLLNIVICFAMALITYGIYRHIKNSDYPNLKVILRGFDMIFRWNFPLLLFCSGLDEVILYSVLDYETFDGGQVTSYISLIFSIFCLIITIYTMYKVFYIVRRYQKNRKAGIVPEGNEATKITRTNTFKKKWKYFQVLYLSFKEDSFIKQAYLVFFLLRVIAYNLFIGLLPDNPKIQITLLTLLSILMMIYLCAAWPCKSDWNTIELISYEITILAINIMVMLLAFDSNADERDSDFRWRIGEGIIISYTIFYSGQLFFLLQSIIQTFIDARKKIKESKAQGRVTCITFLTLPFKAGGMELLDMEVEENEKGQKQQAKIVPVKDKKLTTLEKKVKIEPKSIADRSTKDAIPSESILLSPKGQSAPLIPKNKTFSQLTLQNMKSRLMRINPITEEQGSLANLGNHQDECKQETKIDINSNAPTLKLNLPDDDTLNDLKTPKNDSIMNSLLRIKDKKRRTIASIDCDFSGDSESKLVTPTRGSGGADSSGSIPNRTNRKMFSSIDLDGPLHSLSPGGLRLRKKPLVSDKFSNFGFGMGAKLATQFQKMKKEIGKRSKSMENIDK